MAITIIEGFDLYTSAAGATGVPLNTVWTTPNVQLVAGRFGGQAVTAIANVGAFSRSLPASIGSMAIGFAFKATTLPGSDVAILSLNDPSAGSNQCSLILGAGGILRALRGTAGGTILGSSASQAIFGATWHYIEVEVTISATIGVFNVYVDGISVLALSGQNNKNLVSSVIAAFTFTFGANFFFDDVYVTNTATRLGEQRVETLRATANTATDAWSKLSGVSAFAMTGDTIIDGDTTYIFSSTVGQKTLQGMADFATNPLAVTAVQTSFSARKDDATSRTVRQFNVSGATTTNGVTQAMAAGYLKFNDIYETDPATGLTWTAAAVNALQVGVEVVT